MPFPFKMADYIRHPIVNRDPDAHMPAALFADIHWDRREMWAGAFHPFQFAAIITD